MSLDVRSRLIAKQDDDGLSGREMALRLGMTETYWSHIRNKRRPLSLKVIRRALAVYPDLAYPFLAETMGQSA